MDTLNSEILQMNCDIPTLNLFTDEQVYKPLLNNGDLDPHDNLFVTGLLIMAMSLWHSNSSFFRDGHGISPMFLHAY